MQDYFTNSVLISSTIIGLHPSSFLHRLCKVATIPQMRLCNPNGAPTHRLKSTDIKGSSLTLSPEDCSIIIHFDPLNMVFFVLMAEKQESEPILKPRKQGSSKKRSASALCFSAAIISVCQASPLPPPRHTHRFFSFEETTE